VCYNFIIVKRRLVEQVKIDLCRVYILYIRPKKDGIKYYNFISYYQYYQAIRQKAFTESVSRNYHNNNVHTTWSA